LGSGTEAATALATLVHRVGAQPRRAAPLAQGTNASGGNWYQ
jgi:hypothetical protein